MFILHILWNWLFFLPLKILFQSIYLLSRSREPSTIQPPVSLSHSQSAKVLSFAEASSIPRPSSSTAQYRPPTPGAQSKQKQLPQTARPSSRTKTREAGASSPGYMASTQNSARKEKKSAQREVGDFAHLYSGGPNNVNIKFLSVGTFVCL